MRISKRVIDWINLLLGVWLIISSWVLGTVASTTTTVLVIVGIALIAFSVWALARAKKFAAEWWNFFLGVLLLFLPWTLNYTTKFGIAVNSWIVGVLVAALAFTTMPLIESIRDQKPPHHV